MVVVVCIVLLVMQRLNQASMGLFFVGPKERTKCVEYEPHEIYVQEEHLNANNIWVHSTHISYDDVVRS